MARWTSLAAWLAVLFAERAASQVVRFGSEFQVNTYTTGPQGNPDVAMRDGRGFVIVWESARDGSYRGIFGRRFTSTGAPIGSELQINTHTLGDQRHAAVDMDDDGDFVVVWSGTFDGEGPGVFGKRFDSAGAPVGVEFQINAATSHTQARPAVAVDADGDFVVSWQSYLGQPGENGAFARRFSSSGSALASEFQLVAESAVPAAGRDADGDFVVIWNEYGQDGSSQGLFARRFNSAGSQLGAEFQVNTYTLGPQSSPEVDMNGSGAFTVAFLNNNEISARRFASSGQPLGADFRVNTATGIGPEDGRVGLGDNNGFIVVWNYPLDGAQDGVFGRRFNAIGAAVGAEFQVNGHTLGLQTSPAIGFAASGAFVVAWQSADQDGDSTGIFMQRFTTPLATLDVDGNGVSQALTDGLLVVRFLFGLSGPVLVTGAIDVAGCARCDATQIAFYLQNLAALDVDGDGQKQALTDGLLILRFLFGLTGDALLGGAIDELNCTRCTGPQVEGHLAPLL